ncbi:MAG: glycosyltransferase family 39 protein [Candidatus Omnitrophica bacterium]|nr:glycosyltransferase family 39 protein [Candidatus Omnitrophota bacterium]
MFKEFSRSTWVYLLLLTVLTIPLFQGLFSGQLIDGHDSMAGFIRAQSMSRYMGHGQFLVRWSPEINWGYGYPMFNFYPPFFSFISNLFFQLTHNMVFAINWACVLFWVLSGIGMFLLAREFWGDEGGMISALLYAYAPYHMIDLYVRGAFAEFSSFAFFPFILLSILRMSRKPNLGVFILGVCCIFGLSLTHNIMNMLFLPLGIAYMLYLFFLEKKYAWIVFAIGMFVIGLMMSSFFWLPAFLEKQYLNLNFLIGQRYDFHKNFVSLGDLFWPLNNKFMDRISFQVGVIHSLLCLGTLVCFFKIFKINKQSGSGYVFFLIVGLIAVFFTLPYSAFFWEKISILRFIQFPWRILAIIVFIMSLLCGSLGVLFKNLLVKIFFIILVGLAVFFIYLGTSPRPIFHIYEDTIENSLALGEGEYTPKWIKVRPDKSPKRKFEIVQGQGQLDEEISINPVRYVTKFHALEPSLLCFHTFYFPGWRVYVDGQAIQPYLDNPYGLILFNVPLGDHDIQVTFGLTLVRVIGIIASWAGALLLVAVIFLVKFP